MGAIPSTDRTSIHTEHKQESYTGYRWKQRHHSSFKKVRTCIITQLKNV
jgi:hypothetical protein